MKNLIVVLLLPLLMSCNARLSPVKVSVTDPVRHYYPMVVGDSLKVDYVIANEGKTPLVISEIHLSCGCMSSNTGKMIIPAGKKSGLSIVYDSSGHLGHVCNKVYLYGNFSTGSVMSLEFDLEVLPHSDHIRYYEEYSQKGVLRDYYTE